MLSKLGLDRALFGLAYRRSMKTWDTGIPPQELVDLVEGSHALHPGRALDLGSGTGTNTLYLARHGWQVTGIDFAGPAVEIANRKREEAGSLAGRARFIRGDVTALDTLPLDGPYDLLFDQGCLHTIDRGKRREYAAIVPRYAAPGGLFLLYAFLPRRAGVGMTRDEVRALFADTFTVERVEDATERSGIPSTWYCLSRKAEAD